QEVADGDGQDEVTVREPLHERAGPQTVGAVVGEVSLPQRVQPRDGGHQVVVNPQAAHGVVGGGVNAHGGLHGVFAGDFPVHGEQVPVALQDDLLAQALDGFREVQVHRVARGAHAVAVVAHRFRGPGS